MTDRTSHGDTECGVCTLCAASFPLEGLFFNGRRLTPNWLNLLGKLVKRVQQSSSDVAGDFPCDVNTQKIGVQSLRWLMLSEGRPSDQCGVHLPMAGFVGSNPQCKRHQQNRLAQHRKPFRSQNIKNIFIPAPPLTHCSLRAPVRGGGTVWLSQGSFGTGQVRGRTVSRRLVVTSCILFNASETSLYSFCTRMQRPSLKVLLRKENACK